MRWGGVLEWVVMVGGGEGGMGYAVWRHWRGKWG